MNEERREKRANVFRFFPDKPSKSVVFCLFSFGKGYVVENLINTTTDNVIIVSSYRHFQLSIGSIRVQNLYKPHIVYYIGIGYIWYIYMGMFTIINMGRQLYPVKTEVEPRIKNRRGFINSYLLLLLTIR